MSKPATTIGNVRDDIPPRDTWPTDAILVALAYVAAVLALSACAWAHWGL